MRRGGCESSLVRAGNAAMGQDRNNPIMRRVSDLVNRRRIEFLVVLPPADSVRQLSHWSHEKLRRILRLRCVPPTALTLRMR